MRLQVWTLRWWDRRGWELSLASSPLAVFQNVQTSPGEEVCAELFAPTSQPHDDGVQGC